jgi:hypothetical protein
MSSEIRLEEFLSFDDVDKSAPEKTVSEMCDQLKSQSRDYVQGVVQPYNGHIESYTKVGFSGITAALSYDQKVDIQSDLGKVGYENHQFEFYLSATSLPQYKFRLMFFSYGIGGYPVKIILEQSVADDVFQRFNGKYIVECKSKDELKNTVSQVLNSKRVVQIIQELINASILSQNQEKPELPTGEKKEKPEEQTEDD